MEKREFTKEQVEEIQKGIEQYQELVQKNKVKEERNEHLLRMIKKENRDKIKNVKITLVLSVITVLASLFLLGVTVGRCLTFLGAMGF